MLRISFSQEKAHIGSKNSLIYRLLVTILHVILYAILQSVVRSYLQCQFSNLKASSLPTFPISSLSLIFPTFFFPALQPRQARQVYWLIPQELV